MSKNWVFAVALIVLITKCSAANPGMKISRSLEDASSLIRDLIPIAAEYISASNLGSLNFNTVDNGINVAVTAKNIALTNSTINPSNVSLIIEQPNWFNITFYNFTGDLSFQYSEYNTSKNINKTGTADAFFTGVLIMDAEIQNDDGIPQLYTDVITLSIYEITFQNLNFSTNLTTQFTTRIVNFLQANTGLVFLQAFESRINGYTQSLNWFPQVPDLPIYLNSLWIGTPAISYNPAYPCSNNYVTIWYNGTFVTQDDTSAKMPSIAPSFTMPDRYTNPKGVGSSQIMISQYMLQSYYNAITAKYAYHFIQKLPDDYPNILTSTSGYYPELYQTYGNVPVNLNISTVGAPSVTIVPEIGILVSGTVDVQILTYNSLINQWSYPIYFKADILFLVTPQVKNGVLKGYAYNQKVTSVYNVNSIIGTVNTYNLRMLTADLLKSFIKSYNGSVFFPVFTLPYPSGTTFDNYHLRMESGYIVVDYDAILPLPVFQLQGLSC
ncbi:unnamed protein product [Blepharisma stoltei]|uniref:Uncharacterized protein n=1 Tax=Blepharisma stoltei TaxID=1481888 RepID=A0AAU9JP55_9CILI|nr:unnamed protein product [Blepharisma stoltei]